MAHTNVPNDGGIKEFDARTARIVVDGDSDVEDIESFGFDESKDHDLQYTVDQNAVWVKANPEITGTFVLKASSPSIPDGMSLFQEDTVFSIELELAEDAYGGDSGSVTFQGCMITDVSHSDYEIDGMPTITFDYQAVNRQD